MNKLGISNSTIRSEMCRICLQTTEGIQEASCADITSFQIIVGKSYNIQSTSWYFCLYCRHLLEKFRKFSQQCQTADGVMHNLQQKAEPMSPLNIAPYHNFITTLPTLLSLGPDDELKTENCSDNDVDNRGDEDISHHRIDLHEELILDDNILKTENYGDDDEQFCDDEDVPLSMLNQSVTADVTQAMETSRLRKSREELLEAKRRARKERYMSRCAFAMRKLREIDTRLLLKFKEGVTENDLDNPEESTLTEELHFKKQKKTKRKKREAVKEKEKNRGELREGFSSKMVQEADEYIVIKLTRDQVLQELSEKLSYPAYLRAPYKCDRCAKGFNFEDTHRNHMVKHSMEQGRFECDICFQYCPSAVSLRGHNKSHTTRYKCKQCGLVLLSRQHLLDHYRVTHRPECVAYTCHYCSFNTNKRTIMQRHVKSHGGAATHACEACGRLFKSRESLRVHKSRRHDTSALLRCAHCPRRFALHSQLQRHLCAHHTRPGSTRLDSTQRHYCVECDILFSSQEGFKAHLKRSKKHRATEPSPPPRRPPTPPAAPLQCSTCGRACNTARALASHARRHAPQPRCNRCQHCPEAFTHAYLLRRHMRVHTGERPYQCAECQMKFAQSSTRDTHVRLVHRKLPRKVKAVKESIAEYEKQTVADSDLRAQRTKRTP